MARVQRRRFAAANVPLQRLRHQRPPPRQHNRPQYISITRYRGKDPHSVYKANSSNISLNRAGKRGTNKRFFVDKSIGRRNGGVVDHSVNLALNHSGTYTDNKRNRRRGVVGQRYRQYRFAKNPNHIKTTPLARYLRTHAAPPPVTSFATRLRQARQQQRQGPRRQQPPPPPPAAAAAIVAPNNQNSARQRIQARRNIGLARSRPRRRRR